MKRPDIEGIKAVLGEPSWVASDYLDKEDAEALNMMPELFAYIEELEALFFVKSASEEMIRIEITPEYAQELLRLGVKKNPG
jgi:hypothetical protein